MKTKMELKDVFNGANTLMYQKATVDLSTTEVEINPEYELPVTVDTLQISQDDPTINHYKIIGLDGDWTSSATLGDMTIQFTVPTKHTDVLKLAYGDDAVEEGVKAKINNVGYTGNSVVIKKHKVTGTFIVENEEGDQVMILNNVALWAKPLWENPGTEPFAIQFTGTMETSGTENFAWLTKDA